ncbi:hypothetical protein HZA42_00370 [Candidatus Peregrinibacteria bacterium]|nr:hypothetical protein [Candidatus Peregrinibacteria bacterium]
MARLRNSPDGTIEHEVKFRKIKFACTAPVGSTIELFGNFKNLGIRGASPQSVGVLPFTSTADPNNSRFELEVPDLEVGQSYQYYFKITKGTDLRFEPGPTDKQLMSTGPIPEVQTFSLGTTTPPDQIRASVERRVKDIAEGLRTHEGVQGVDATMELLEIELDNMDMKGDQTKIILHTLNKVFGEMEHLPAVTKNRFREKPVPADFQEFKTRLQKGSEAYRKKVLLSLVADKKTREALHLKAGDRTIDDEHTRKAFNRVCNQFDLGDTVPYLEVAFEGTRKIPPNDPAITQSRRHQMGEVLKRLAAHGKPTSILGKVPSGRWGKMLDVAVQLGSAGLLFTGTAPIVGLAGLAGKSVLETLTGLSSTNIIDSFKGGGGHKKKGLWGTFIESNVVSRMLTTEGKAADVLKTRFSDCLKRMIPFTSFSYGGAAVGGDHGQEEHHEETHEEVDAEAVIRTVCEKELK